MRPGLGRKLSSSSLTVGDPHEAADLGQECRDKG
jgi:hypothetical protein